MDLEGQHGGGENFFMSKNKKKSTKKDSRVKKITTGISMERETKRRESVKGPKERFSSYIVGTSVESVESLFKEPLEETGSS